jgi:hypothetical protein
LQAEACSPRADYNNAVERQSHPTARCAVEAARLYCEGRTRTVQKRHVPEHRRRPFSTFLAGKSMRRRALQRNRWSSQSSSCLGSQPLGMVSRLLRQLFVLFVVESQSALRLHTSASWRRCPLRLESGPLARAKLQRYRPLHARLARSLRNPVEEDVAGPRRIERHRNIPRIFAESAGRFGRL